MNILVITGSPHLNGTSATLANSFIKGIDKKRHDVYKVDAAALSIKGCFGCGYCRSHNDICVQDDEMKGIMKQVIKADIVVFVTPLYIMGMTAQLKTVLDRFYVLFPKLQTMKKKAILMVTCNDLTSKPITPIKLHYETFIDNLGWDNIAELFAQGCNTKKEIESSLYLEKAYQLGMSL